MSTGPAHKIPDSPLKRGTMLDATVIETIAARPGDGRPSSDPEAGFTRRQGKTGSSCGYKAQVGVDEGSGLIRAGDCQESCARGRLTFTGPRNVRRR